MSTDAGDPSEPPQHVDALLDETAELRTARSGIVSFLRDAVDRADADGVVVGLSGGVDSALAAFLAAEALGSDRVCGLTLPSSKLERRHANDARTVASEAGIEFEEVTLRPVVDEFRATVGDALVPEPDEHTVGNAIARLRMACLYAVANDRSLLILGTANRTELLTGYVTKYGDSAADVYPLGDLYKTEIRALARYVGVPEPVVAKPSTAGFWANQTDEGELGAPYEAIDALLHRTVDEGLTVSEALEGVALDRSTAMDLLARCVDSAHKRTPPPRHRIRDRPNVNGSVSDGGSAPDRATETGRSFDPAPDRGETVTPSRAGSASPRRASADVAADDGLADVDPDRLFRALAEKRRRIALDILLGCEEAMTVTDLVFAVTERERRTSIADVSADRVDRVAVSMGHKHLPVLRNAGLVDHDGEAETVAASPLAERLRPRVAPFLG